MRVLKITTLINPTIRIFVLAFTVIASVNAQTNPDWAISYADGSTLIGPLNSNSETELLQSHLDANSISYETRQLSAEESLEFIVVTSSYENKLAAEADLQALQDAGIKDYLYVGRGDYVNRISIGVFASLSSAQSRMASVNTHGFEFDVVERFRSIQLTEIVLTNPELSHSQLQKILAGEVIDRPVTQIDPARIKIQDQQRAITEVVTEPIDEGEIRIEKDSAAETESEQLPITKPTPDIPVAVMPAPLAELESDTKPEIKSEPESQPASKSRDQRTNTNCR